MKINKKNYEVYFIDFLDGKLNKNDIDEIFMFLEHNPQYKEEFDNLSSLETLIPDNVNFPNKNSLKKNINIINDNNVETYIIASLEGDLNNEEQKAFDVFCKQNPQITNTIKQFQNTKAKPDTSVVFPNKSALKRANFIGLFNIRLNTIYNYAAAASVALLIGLFLTNEFINQPVIYNNALSIQKSNLGFEPNILSNKSINETQNTDNEPVIYIVQSNNKTNINIEKLTETIETVNYKPVASINNIEIVSLDEECKIVKNYFSNNYHHIINYDKASNNEINEPDKENNSSSFGSFAVSWFKKQINSDSYRNNPSLNKISWTDVAELGIAGVNRATGTDLQLAKNEDDNGNLSNIEFKGGNLNIKKNIQNK